MRTARGRKKGSGALLRRYFVYLTSGRNLPIDLLADGAGPLEVKGQVLHRSIAELQSQEGQPLGAGWATGPEGRVLAMLGEIDGKASPSSRFRSGLGPPRTILVLGRRAPYIMVDRSERGAGLPVAFRLSKKFSETFGDELADEFVNWFNQVDTTYRTDLVELNDRNFTKLDARIAQVEARVDRRLSEFESQMVERMATLEVKLDRSMTALEVKLDRRMTVLEARVEERLAGFRTEMSGLRVEMAGLRAEMASFKAELIKWMFLFWLGTVGTTVAIVGLLL